MTLRPLGSRVIVRPDAPETVSAGGIIFPQTHGSAPAMTGTVVRVGTGPASAHRVRQAAIDRCRVLVASAVADCEDDARAALDRRLRAYAEETDPLPAVRDGDYGGHALTLIASNSRRSVKLRAMETTVKIPPIIRLSASDVCSPNSGNTAICVSTASP